MCRHVSVISIEEVQNGVTGFLRECQEGAGLAGGASRPAPPAQRTEPVSWVVPAPELRRTLWNPLTDHPAPKAQGQRWHGAEGSRMLSAIPRLFVSVTQVCVP